MNPTPIHPKLAEITERIIERSRPTREKYLAKIRSAKQMGRLERNQLGCSNLAHGYASMPKSIKIEMLQDTVPNLGIITAYNDMVSAHQPFKDFPDQIKDEAQKNGATAQDDTLAAGLTYSRETGNSYTASLYASLAAMLDNRDDLGGKTLGGGDPL